MTLKIHSEEDDQRQLKMKVEVDEARVEKEMRKAARKLARDIHVPGFRPGKAPYRVILRRVGRDPLRAEVVEEMVQPVLEEAVEQAEVELSAPPSLDDIEMEPLVLSFTVPLTPQVELSDYRGLRKEIEPVAIADKAIDEALEQIRVKNQKLEEVDRPSQAGDMVTISGVGQYATLEDDLDAADDSDEEIEPSEGDDEDQLEEPDGEKAVVEQEGADLEGGGEEAPAEADEPDEMPEQGFIFQEESIELLLDAEKLFAGTPFVENLVGLSAGDETSYTFIFPEEFEDESLVGKEGTFNVTVLNVKSRELPDLDDELAKLEGDYETVEELRDATVEQLTKQAESQARNDLIEGLIDDLLPYTSVVYPPALVEQEIDGMVETFRRQISGSGWEWDDYLKLQGDSEDRVRENFRDSAETALTRRFALRQFVLREKLTVEEEDVEAAIAARIEDFGGNDEFKTSMADFYRTGSGLEMISSDILMEKSDERAKALYAGNAPDLAEESVEQSDEEE